MDSILRLEFRSPGVKGHMHINQQQSFEYISLKLILWVVEFATEVYSPSLY